ncbi:MAG: hypothetical protein EPN84_07440 [Legionella sp.]|nr:MAG: hypothetical protein EPN84_07440 [Legionella sp.]
MSQSDDALQPLCVHPLEKLIGKLSTYKDIPDKDAYEQFIAQDKLNAVDRLIRSIRNKSALIDGQDCAILNDGLIKLMIEDYLRENQPELQAYFQCSQAIDKVDQLINQLNQLDPVAKLIAILEQHQEKIAKRLESNCALYHSHVFKPSAANKKLEVIQRLIGVFRGHDGAAVDDGDLKIVSQSSIGKQIDNFIVTYQSSLSKHCKKDSIKNLKALVIACEKSNKQFIN